MANTYTWTGATNNDWTNSSDWNLNSGFPGSADTDVALITLASAAPTIDAGDGPITLDSITLNANSGSLTISGDTLNVGSLAVDGGTVAVASDGIVNLGSAAGAIQVGGNPPARLENSG